MKKNYFLGFILCTIFFCNPLYAQQTVVETFEVSPSVPIWINANEDAPQPEIVANPQKGGINPSDSVMLWIKAKDGPVYAAAMTDLQTYTINFTGDAKYMHLKMLKNNTDPCALQVIRTNDGYTESGKYLDPPVRIPCPIPNEWVDYVFDFSDTAATNHSWSRLYFMAVMNATEEGGWTKRPLDNDVNVYFDDIVIDSETAPYTTPLPTKTVIESFEESINVPIWLNANEDAPQPEIVANPQKGGINPSDSVMLWIKAKDSPVYAAAMTDLQTYTINFTGDAKYMHLKMLKNNTDPCALQVIRTNDGYTESGKDLDPPVRIPCPIPNEWVDYVFDFSDTAATNHSWSRLYFMAVMNATEEGGWTKRPLDNDVNVYFDDIVIDSETAPYTTPLPTKTVIESFEESINVPIWLNANEDAPQPEIVANPQKGGINPSDSVMLWIKAKDSPVYAAAMTDLQTYTINFTGDAKYMHLKMLKNNTDPCALQVIRTDDGYTESGKYLDPPVRIPCPIPNEWVDYVFDFSDTADTNHSW